MNEFAMNEIEEAAKAIAECDALVIGAGAGMGVDSGLPDFRGNEGFWKAYPPMERAGLSFYDLANPKWFDADPNRAWGFYGHRRNLYRETHPHEGFQTLLDWGRAKSGGYFVYASNVDGHFQAAGFDPDCIVECHGAINLMQCAEPCSRKIWQAEQVEIDVDLESFRACGELPRCGECGSIARPNILMFSDSRWIEDATGYQYDRYSEWLQRLKDFRVTVIEIGAGTAVPTVRHHCERISSRFGGTLIRINPRESEGANAVSVALGAAEALDVIAALL